MRTGVRRPLLGWAVALALALGGCGGSSDSPAASSGPSDPGHTPPTPNATKTAAAAPAKRRGPRAAPAGERCQAQLGGFVSSMDALRRRLAVGVTYEQYVDEIDAVRATYRKIPADRLAIDCLGAAGSPGEEAFNRYIDAANSWGECIAEAGCDSAGIEPVLQRKWRIASHLLKEAEGGLRQVDG